MKLSFDSLRDYIQRKIAEKRQVSEFIKLEGVNDRQAVKLKWYYEVPSLLLTVKKVENRLVISNQTARADLQNFAERDFVHLINVNKKKQAFAKSDEFDRLIDRQTSKKSKTTISIF